MDFDTNFSGDIKNGVLPRCCWCSARLDPTVMDLAWFWFVSGIRIYYAHTECGQNNMAPEDAEDFIGWLRKERKELKGDDFFTSSY